MTNESWPIPEDLDPLGRTAAETLRDFFAENGITGHGGGGKFYSPREWAARGERYGTESLLIVTHEGGNHAGAFNLDYQQYALFDAMVRRLDTIGVFCEACTSWYSAIYPA